MAIVGEGATLMQSSPRNGFIGHTVDLLHHCRLCQLPFQHLFLHQVLHSANLHLVYVVHKTGPICCPVPTFHGLWLAGRVDGGGVVIGGGHTVTAVTDAKAPESRRNVWAGEGSPAALTSYWPAVPVNLLLEDTTRQATLFTLFCTGTVENYTKRITVYEWWQFFFFLFVFESVAVKIPFHCKSLIILQSQYLPK